MVAILLMKIRMYHKYQRQVTSAIVAPNVQHIALLQDGRVQERRVKISAPHSQLQI